VKPRPRLSRPISRTPAISSGTSCVCAPKVSPPAVGMVTPLPNTTSTNRPFGMECSAGGGGAAGGGAGAGGGGGGGGRGGGGRRRRRRWRRRGRLRVREERRGDQCEDERDSFHA